MKKLPALAVSLFFFASSSFAVPILFDLRDTSAETEIESGTILRGGVTATLTPIVDLSSGVLSQNSSSFGINAAGTGDSASLLDGVLGAESISITFSQSVLFTELGLSGFSSGTSGTDAASLTLNGFAPISLVPMPAASDIYTFASDNLILTGSTVILAWESYNGFSFDNFTIDTDVPTTGSPAAVPESGTTVGFLGLAVFGVILFRRFRC